MLNIAYAMSNIRFYADPSEMNNHEKSLLRVVKDEIKMLTGIEVSDSYIRQYLRNLPHSKPVPIERIEEFNRLSKNILMSA